MWERFLQEAFDWMIGSGLTIIVALVLMVVLLLISKLLLNRLRSFIARPERSAERIKQIDTMIAVLRHIVTITIVAVSALVIVSELGIDLSPVLTAVGITGLAVSFGAQSLVRDVISGFFMLLEDQVRVGDVVAVGEHSGSVEAITLRTIRLRDLAGNVHIIPNGEVRALVNMTKGFGRKTIDVAVAYKEDVDWVVDVLQQIGEEICADEEFGTMITEPFKVLGVQELGESAVVIRTLVTTQPGSQWAVAREINRRIKIRFDEEGIEIPYPHRTIQWVDRRESMDESS